MTPKEEHPSVGQYYLVEKIARGGMAEIYKGISYEATGLKRTVCVKKILPDIAANQEFIDALIDEAKIAVKLSHGNVAQIFDLGRVGNDYFIVMEYVDGKTISQIYRRTQLKGEHIAPSHACFVMSEVLAALDYVHRRVDEEGKPLKIVHRDVSPQNIMISFSGTVKVIDFGIAKAAIRLGVTEAGVLKGKFAYMSPEQAQGEPLDNRSDIFSLGVIFHELLTGKRLFKAEDSRETLRNVRKAKVIPPSQLRPELPDSLDSIVMKCLARERSRRYASASDMRDDLTRFLYNNYPDYRPSDLATYAKNLFADEINQKISADSKSESGVVIDGTHSALSEGVEETTGSIRAPIDIGEYIPYELDDDEDAKDDKTDEEELSSSLVSEELTVSFVKRRWKWTALIGVTAAFIVALTIGFMNRSDFKKDDKFTPPVMTGKAMVKAQPKDSKIYVDGELKGKRAPLTISGLKPGDHNLSVRKDGFVPYYGKFSVDTGEITKLEVSLKQKVPVFASIQVVSVPKGAEIFLDDNKTSYKTPAKLDKITPNKHHKVGLHMSGFKFWQRKFTAKPGENRYFEVALKTNFSSIILTSIPKNSLIVVNGTPVGETPWRSNKIEPGKVYKVEVWKEGYKTVKREIKLKPGKELRFKAVLEKKKRKK